MKFSKNIKVSTMSRGYTAFTLAEILIVLGIIGIIAQMTIPTLVNNYQKTQQVESLKIAYSTFTQALKQVSLDRGCVDDLICTGLFASGTTTQSLGQALVKYFKTVKVCDMTASSDCWKAGGYKYYMNFDGSGTPLNGIFMPSFYYSFQTASGVLFAVRSYAPSGVGWYDCGKNYYWGGGAYGNLSKTCGELYVDINGVNKGPNRFGRDLFLFSITNGMGAAIYPIGAKECGGTWWNQANQNYCSSDNANKSGTYCTGRIIEKNWVMDY